MENRGYGRVYTYRKEDGMGYGVYDPEKVFFILDPEGKVYINDRRCTIIKKGELPPCEAMTLRFKFSNTTYDPVVAGVGGAGTWNQVRSNPNIWDWTNTNADWTGQFMNAFKSNSNKVEVIDAGDTSGVTILYNSFRYCSSIVSICLFDTQNVANFAACFSETGIEECPLYDTRNATSLRYMFYNCTELKHIPLFNTSKLDVVNYFAYGCSKVESGALASYQQMSSQENPPTDHISCFTNCGIYTPTGLAELQQIPSSWGGLGA